MTQGSSPSFPTPRSQRRPPRRQPRRQPRWPQRRQAGGVIAAVVAATGIAALAGCADLDPYALSRSPASQGGDRTVPADSGTGQRPPGPATGGSGPGAGRTEGPRGGNMPPASLPSATSTGLPASVIPPAPAKERSRARAVGDITYECRRHLTEPTRFVWSFVVPNATLYDANQRPIGRYYAGPTWEGRDKSKVTGRQVGSAPVSPSDLPLQLIKADVSTGTGVMKGVSYIQRLNTSGGLPAGPCDASLAGKRQQVPFQADYVFY